MYVHVGVRGRVRASKRDCGTGVDDVLYNRETDMRCSTNGLESSSMALRQSSRPSHVDELHPSLTEWAERPHTSVGVFTSSLFKRLLYALCAEKHDDL